MWSDFTAWLQSSTGQRVLGPTVPLVAVLLAALLAALIVGAAIRRARAESRHAAAVDAAAQLLDAAGQSRSGARGTAERLSAGGALRLAATGLPGAAAAAEWGRARALEGAGDGLAAVLLEWLEHPGRAKRLFGRAGSSAVIDRGGRGAGPATPATEPAGPATEERGKPERGGGGQQPHDRPAQPEGSARPGGEVTVPPPAAEPAGPDLTPEVDDRGPAPVPETVPESIDATGERPAAVVVTPEEIGEQHPRHSRGEDAPPRSSRPDAPSWLDDYDDEAMVTRDIPLKPPSPVAATTVRNRNRAGEDIVPRS